MDIDLFREITDELDQFNPDICNGYAVKDLKDSIEYMNDTLKCADASFPAPFKYIGIRRLSPDEEYRYLTEDKDTRREYDITESDCYMAEISFDYDGVPIKKNIYLPFVRKGGIMKLRDSTYVVTPVVADRVFSVSERDIFVILNRTKFKLVRIQYPIYKDGDSSHNYVVSANIYNESKKKKGTKGMSRSEAVQFPDINTTTGHYLFCEYGVTEAFKRFYGVDVIITDQSTVDDLTINHDEWTRYSSIYANSTRFRPKALGQYTEYVGTNLVVLLRKDDIHHNPSLATLVTNFFYVVDHYPKRFTLENIDEVDTWRLALGFIIHRSNESEGKLLNSMDDHLNSIMEYVDGKAIELLRDEDVFVHDIFELFDHFNKTISDRIQNAAPGDMWGKYLVVKRYILSPITDAIFLLQWDLEKQKDSLSLRKVRWRLGTRLQEGTYLGILKGHGEKTSVQYPGDCMLFKHTCISVRQINAVTKGKQKKIDVRDVSYHLHPSIAECGSYCNFPKPSPDGRTKLNPYALTSPNGRFIRNPKFIALLDQTKEEISLV